MECNVCGETLSAATDEELVQTARRHMDDQHPDAAPDDARLSELVEERAYDAMDS
jgi:hypothetical protein